MTCTLFYLNKSIYLSILRRFYVLNFGFRIGIATRTRQRQERHVSEVIDEYLTSRSLVKDGTTQAVFDTEMQNRV